MLLNSDVLVFFGLLNLFQFILAMFFWLSNKIDNDFIRLTVQIICMVIIIFSPFYIITNNINTYDY